MPRTTRREILAGGAITLGARLAGLEAQESQPTPAPLALRELGKTGRKLPLLGLGCFPMGNLKDEDDGVAVARHALESGARYLDTAPSYNSGVSERRVGKAIRDWKREDLWIATKTLHRDGDAALKELEESLARLQTDYVDCLQVHEVHEDWETLFEKGGVIAALESAREKKKLRHIGITGHRDPALLLKALERYPFATALVPVNPLDCHHRSFTQGFVAKARERGTAVIAMKIYAGGKLPETRKQIPVADLVRFALAQEGVCVAVPGADSIARWDEARAAALKSAPNAAEQAKLIAAAGPHQGKSSEWYKNA